MDHREEAARWLEAADRECSEGASRAGEAFASVALVHSQLAVADELKGIREAIGDYLGDGTHLSRISEALEEANRG